MELRFHRVERGAESLETEALRGAEVSQGVYF